MCIWLIIWRETIQYFFLYLLFDLFSILGHWGKQVNIYRDLPTVHNNYRNPHRDGAITGTDHKDQSYLSLVLSPVLNRDWPSSPNSQTVDTTNQKSHLSHISAATIFWLDSNKILSAVPSVLYGNIPRSACAGGPGPASGRDIWAASFSFRWDLTSMSHNWIGLVQCTYSSYNRSLLSLSTAILVYQFILFNNTQWFIMFFLDFLTFKEMFLDFKLMKQQHGNLSTDLSLILSVSSMNRWCVYPY